MKMKNLLLLFSLMTLLVATGGCIFSPDDDNGGGETSDEGLPVAITQEIMMNNFKQIYENMEYEDYENLLHEGFRMVLLQETIDSWNEAGDRPLESEYFDKTSEAGIHYNMFNDIGGFDAHGEPVPSIDRIDVEKLDIIGSWNQIDSSVEYFGQNYPTAYTARFEVLITFHLPGNTAFQVDQDVDFITIQEDDVWYLLGQIGH